MKCPMCDGEMEQETMSCGDREFHPSLHVLRCAGLVGYGEDGCGYWLPCNSAGQTPYDQAGKR